MNKGSWIKNLVILCKLVCIINGFFKKKVGKQDAMMDIFREDAYDFAKVEVKEQP